VQDFMASSMVHTGVGSGADVHGAPSTSALAGAFAPTKRSERAEGEASTISGFDSTPPGNGSQSRHDDDDSLDMNSFSDFAFTPSAHSMLSPFEEFSFTSGASPATAHNMEHAGSGSTIGHLFHPSVGGEDATGLEWTDDQQAAAHIAEFFASTNLDVPEHGELSHEDAQRQGTRNRPMRTTWRRGNLSYFQ